MRRTQIPSDTCLPPARDLWVRALRIRPAWHALSGDVRARKLLRMLPSIVGAGRVFIPYPAGGGLFSPSTNECTRMSPAVFYLIPPPGEFFQAGGRRAWPTWQRVN